MEVVILKPMNDEEFKRFRRVSAAEYAEDKVKAGTWKQEEALGLSEEAYANYLPDGLRTREHYFYSIRRENGEDSAGWIWLHVSDAPAGKRAFLYDIRLEEEYRGRGLGQAAMRALDETARALGASEIGLHVFGHNPAALRVYEKAGYAITDYKMAKSL
ncbi:GNAT family N-acetyltransferase [Saccharibacillus sp. CPCC 101409]|uniref:GNAT family N-acetyltransferase n=1 Tax=Saccharibacillus sp. CPCC 101409 TaxID=3058041 RepID=UPI00267408B4|nr:GNAT family N-acetyltransferase [Saccharibacillus sp. CPCC 101409]MDO3408220.1 GNAT family N-acetyltransferase [Saccharibacillus sp. CPCC 101409]